MDHVRRGRATRLASPGAPRSGLVPLRRPRAHLVEHVGVDQDRPGGPASAVRRGRAVRARRRGAARLAGGAARPLGTDVGLAALLGLLPFATTYGLIYWAEQHVPSGLAAVLFGALPLYVALLAAAFLPGEPCGRGCSSASRWRSAAWRLRSASRSSSATTSWPASPRWRSRCRRSPARSATCRSSSARASSTRSRSTAGRCSARASRSCSRARRSRTGAKRSRRRGDRLRSSTSPCSARRSRSSR
jgi:hypothetical protein